MREVTLTVVVRIIDESRPEKWIADAINDGLYNYRNEELVSIEITADKEMK